MENEGEGEVEREFEFDCLKMRQNLLRDGAFNANSPTPRAVFGSRREGQVPRARKTHHLNK